MGRKGKRNKRVRKSDKREWGRRRNRKVKELRKSEEKRRKQGGRNEKKEHQIIAILIMTLV